MTLPAGGTNTVSAPAVSQGSSASTPNGGSAITATATAMLSAHFLWQSTAANDTPPSVMVFEQVTAYALGSTNDASGNSVPVIGTVSDGLGDNLQPDQNGQVAGQAYITKSGGSFDVPLSINATVTASPGPNYTVNGGQGIGRCMVSAGITAVTLSIHAQPYNFRQTSVSVNSPAAGDLNFTYDWSSTTGQKSDLTTCYTHERVTYGGSLGVYYPPLPFVQNPIADPTTYPGLYNFSTHTDGGFPMSNTTTGDVQNIVPGKTPYKFASFTGTQDYEFDDTATQQFNVIVPGPGAGPYSIVRTVKSDPNLGIGYWEYTCTKNGYTATLSGLYDNPINP